ncbi:MAG: Tfp pilus assembly protein PilX [Desulforhopalus sp.]|jgi:Tfp pilus assembly protein PilX
MFTVPIPKQNEEGFVLVVALMMLLVLSIIGALATNSTITELSISGNNKVHKQTFYQADGATELAQHLMYHNAICETTSGGFSTSSIGANIFFTDTSFSSNKETAGLYTTISDTARTVVFYPDNVQDDTTRHTNVLNTSKVIVNPGSSLAMVSGYDGSDVSSVGGTSKSFTIASQHLGHVNSESILQVQWQINNSVLASASAFDCEY